MRRGLLALLAMLAGLGAVAGVAQARPWTTTYDWDGGGAGYDGWRPEEAPAGDGQPGPFYTPFRGGAPEGAGLGVVPIGGRVYGNGDASRPDGGPAGRLVLDAPGASTITEVEFGAARFRNQSEGQIFRLRLGSTPGAADTRDYFPANGYPQDTRNELGDVTLRLAAGGRRAEMGLLTTCPGRDAPQTPPYECRFVSPSSRSFGHVGSARIVYDDPDQPTVTIATDPPIDGGWENRPRARTVTAAGEDSSSGIRRIRVDVRTGTMRRTLVDRLVPCDGDHATGDHGALECPPRAEASGRDEGRDGASTREYVVTVTDRAGNETVQSVVARRDLVAPSSASVGGELLGLTRAWTNRRGPVPVRLSATDGLSGVSRIELRALPVGPGRSSTLATVTPDCGGGCRSVSVPTAADLDQIADDGRYRLRVVATDRAGNERAVGVPGVLRIDRTAPRPTTAAAPRYEVRGDGSIRLTFRSGRDPSPGSGVRLFVFRYTVAASATASSRAVFLRLAEDPPGPTQREVRFRETRSQSFVFRPEGRLDPSAGAALLTLDRAEGADAPREVAGGEYGNVLEVRAVAARSGTSAQEIYVDQGIERLERYVNDAGRRVRDDGRGRRLKRGLRGVARIAGRAVALGAIADFLVNADSISCKQGRSFNDMNDRARRTFAVSGDALERAGASSLGGADRAKQLVDSSIRRVRSLNDYARRTRRLYDDSECAAGARYALKVTADLGPTLKSASSYLSVRRQRDQRRKAYRIATDVSRRAKYGTNNCSQARSVANRFGGAGAGKPNYVVYWSPPPPPDALVRYVGISRALPSRCQSYRQSPRFRARGRGLQTLNLPHLYLQEARNVEEALIAHFGPDGERNRSGVGQLDNRRHEVSPGRPEYCTRLLRGQYLLAVNGYGRYAGARFTRGRRCPGVGGLR